MPKLERIASFKNLAQFRTFITDTDPNSRFFRLSEVPDTLTAGKNAFLITGAPELEPTTKVLVELIDANGKTIFLQPIGNYAEGLARVISVEIYQDTPPGPALLTILGEAIADANGHPIPPEWQNKYNVKFQRQFNVDPNQHNSTKVRLYHIPQLSVTESLIPYQQSVSGSIISLSSGTVTGFSRFLTVNDNDQTPNSYVIQISQPFFSSSMAGASFTASIPNAGIFTSSIAQIWNDTTAFLDVGYIVGDLYSSFTTSNYTMSFRTPPVFRDTLYTRSYADLIIGPLTTFAGEIRRVRLSMKSLDSSGNYELVSDVRLDVPDLEGLGTLDLMITQSSNVIPLPPPPPPPPPTVPFPNSAIMGVGYAAGSGSYPGYIQLLNPTSSTVNLKVYEIRFSQPFSNADASTYGISAKFTSASLNIGSGSLISALQRLDEQDVTGITAVLQGVASGTIIPSGSTTSSLYYQNASLILENNLGWTPITLWQVVTFTDVPITIPPGRALEFSSLATGSGVAIRVYTVHDEVAI